jgi:hypothetical protein
MSLAISITAAACFAVVALFKAIECRELRDHIKRLDELDAEREATVEALRGEFSKSWK